MAKREVVRTEVAGRKIEVSNPQKIFFPALGLTKLDLVAYYVTVAEAALRGAGGRPMSLKRYPNGVEGDFFFQKRAPDERPSWVDCVEFRFPSGRTACEIVLGEAAALAWVANLGCIDLNPHPVRADDLDHPDELRIDLDPVPGVAWKDVCKVALVAGDVLKEHGLVAWPKTSGSRGLHVYARIERKWSFDELRRAALAVGREVERRVPKLACTQWFKEERHGVFVDYNQNARDRTTASAYSVRPTPDARVSTPLAWDEVEHVDPAKFTLRTVPARLEEIGDPWAKMDESPGSLDSLLALSRDQERQGKRDAPWPPFHTKKPDEPKRAPARGRVPKKPLIVVARATRQKEALDGLERWMKRHADVAKHLEPSDVLVDSMRGKSSTWTRVRINLEHVPAALRPAPEPPSPDSVPRR